VSPKTQSHFVPFDAKFLEGDNGRPARAEAFPRGEQESPRVIVLIMLMMT